MAFKKDQALSFDGLELLREMECYRRGLERSFQIHNYVGIYQGCIYIVLALARHPLFFMNNWNRLEKSDDN
jgi:predicted ferric reductase